MKKEINISGDYIFDTNGIASHIKLSNSCHARIIKRLQATIQSKLGSEYDNWKNSLDPPSLNPVDGAEEPPLSFPETGIFIVYYEVSQSIEWTNFPQLTYIENNTVQVGGGIAPTGAARSVQTLEIGRSNIAFSEVKTSHIYHYTHINADPNYAIEIPYINCVSSFREIFVNGVGFENPVGVAIRDTANVTTDFDVWSNFAERTFTTTS